MRGGRGATTRGADQRTREMNERREREREETNSFDTVPVVSREGGAGGTTDRSARLIIKPKKPKAANGDDDARDALAF